MFLWFTLWEDMRTEISSNWWIFQTLEVLHTFKWLNNSQNTPHSMCTFVINSILRLLFIIYSILLKIKKFFRKIQLMPQGYRLCSADTAPLDFSKPSRKKRCACFTYKLRKVWRLVKEYIEVIIDFLLNFKTHSKKLSDLGHSSPHILQSSLLPFKDSLPVQLLDQTACRNVRAEF